MNDADQRGSDRSGSLMRRTKSTADETDPGQGPGRLRNAVSAWKVIIATVVTVAIVVLAFGFDIRALLQNALDWIQRIGPWGPAFLILIYTVATVLFVPGTVLTLGAGAAFGVLWGSVYVSLGSMLGATAAFLAGRYLARDAISRRVDGNGRFAALDKAVADEGWMIVFLTRLSPIFPFNLLNYAFGLTRVSLRDYVFASWVGMMPGTVLYVYLGSLARASLARRGITTGEWVLYGVGFIATVVVTVFVTRLAKKTLTERALRNPE